MAIETLDAKLSKILFHQPSRFDRAGTKFLIARTSCGRTVKGSMEQPIEELRYRFYGESRPQKGRDEEAFEFSTYEEIIETSADGLTNYLRRKIAGIGQAKARAIVDHFGDEALSVLMAAPDRLADVAGITPAIIGTIKASLADRSKADPVSWVAVANLFEGHKVSEKIIDAIVKDFGPSAVDQVRKLPYATLIPYRGMGWVKVDAIATTNLGYDPEGLDRHCAGIAEAIQRLCNDQGHTLVARVDAAGGAHELLGHRPKAEAWDALESERRIVVRRGPDGEEVAPADLADAEWSIAWRVDRLTAAAKPLDPIEVGPRPGRLPLNADQLLAVAMMEGFGVSILAGAPGTGKSYTMAEVIAALWNSGYRNVRVVAPTGKAAKRAAELIAGALPGATIPCTTIHRALAPSPSDAKAGTPSSSSKVGRGRDEFQFAKNEANPLDVSVLFIDECSMVDTKLMSSLLKAVPDGARVVFVGDPNQLPSVGPGSVLRDLIASGLPATILDKIVRSDGGGSVVRACHAIKAGRRPEPATKVSLPTDNWVHIEVEEIDAIAAEILSLCRSMRAFPDPVWDIQVVSPIYKGAAGCNALNDALGKHLNPIRADESAEERWPFDFRRDDKVVRTKNGAADELVEAKDNPADFHWRGVAYETSEISVVNGDMGTVLDFVEGKDPSIVVRFRDPDRLCRVPADEHYLSPAYALTCHKAQGSGFPVVIVPVHNCFPFNPQTQRGVWTREWLYTAISRAEKLLVTVGQTSAMSKAIGRVTINQRNTRLRQCIELATAEVPVKVIGGPT